MMAGPADAGGQRYPKDDLERFFPLGGRHHLGIAHRGESVEGCSIGQGENNCRGDKRTGPASPPYLVNTGNAMVTHREKLPLEIDSWTHRGRISNHTVSVAKQLSGYNDPSKRYGED